MDFRSTLEDTGWVELNRSQIVNLFPETWTHIHNINMLQVGFGFKLLGLDWRNLQDLSKIFAALERKRFLLRDGFTVRRGNHVHTH